jgi:hypothetical protein
VHLGGRIEIVPSPRAPLDHPERRVALQRHVAVYTAVPGTEDADRLGLAVVLGTQSLHL